MSIELYTEDRLVYQYYPVTSNTLLFKIKACNDAHIALTSTPYESHPMYEIFFGGWKNTKSVIRKNQQQPDVVEIPTPNILDANNYQSFWIRWEYGILSTGLQGNSSPLMMWQDSEMFPIQYFGICTGWGAKGHWIIENTPTTITSIAPAHFLQNSNSLPIGFVSENNFQITKPDVKWISCSNGVVPPNATIGGADVNGELVYIVRAPHEGALLPGKLVPSHKVAYVPWGGRENPKTDYEVLCDCYPKWVSVSGQLIPREALPAGKSENGETLYVGRSQHDGSTTPGKVQLSHGVCYIPFGGCEIAKQEYEILTM